MYFNHKSVVEICKNTVPVGHFLFISSETFAVGLSFSHNAQRHRVTDGRTTSYMVYGIRPLLEHNTVIWSLNVI